jgi:hypothetical protein
MSTPRTPTELSSQEASDLLHKLLSESTRIKAVLIFNGFPQNGVWPPTAQLTGTLQKLPEEMLTVLSDDGGITASLTFDPRAATSVTWGDGRVLPSPSTPAVPGFPRILSGLFFKYEVYAVVLFEIPGDQ